MLIPVNLLKKEFKVNPLSILHVGAHEAEELSEYEENWLNIIHPIYWIEGQPDLVKNLRLKLNKSKNVTLEAYVWSEDDIKMEFNLATNSQSSSLLDFGTHLVNNPEITNKEKIKIQTKRLDSIIPKEIKFDFINLDLQGVELQALKGLGGRIHEARWIYTEVNKEEVYKDCTEIKELDSYLRKFGFRRIATRWVKGQGWGDALYAKNPNFYIRIIKKIKFNLRELFIGLKLKLHEISIRRLS
jgi:FkbM family methyltransferase